MATIKSFTSLEQSRKLAEILPFESADMCFYNDGTAIKIDANSYNIRKQMWKDYVEVIPCWSLAALLDVLPSGKALIHDKETHEYKCICKNIDTDFHNNSTDACYEMILKLHELKML